MVLMLKQVSSAANIATDLSRAAAELKIAKLKAKASDVPCDRIETAIQMVHFALDDIEEAMKSFEGK